MQRQDSLYPHVFIHYKAPRDHGYKEALDAFECSLQALGRSQLDLYLIHWPGAQGLKKEDPENKVFRQESWRALEQLHRDGN